MTPITLHDAVSVLLLVGALIALYAKRTAEQYSAGKDIARHDQDIGALRAELTKAQKDLNAAHNRLRDLEFHTGVRKITRISSENTAE